MNGVAPVYFEIQSDGKDNSNCHFTRWQQFKAHKKRLIYSSPSLGVATTSNGSAVSRSVSNNVGAEQNVLPTSDKSSGLSNSTISHKQEKGNENPNASNEAIEPKESELERKIRERVENSHVPKLLKAIEKRYDKRVSNFVYGVF